MKIILKKRLIGKRIAERTEKILLHMRSVQTRLPGGAIRTGGVGLRK